MTEKKKWNSEKGRWKDKTLAAEAGRLGGVKSGITKRANKELKELISNPVKLRDFAVGALLDKDPEVFNKVVNAIAENAINGDKFAQSMMVSMGGLDAPKKAELKVEQDMSPEEALQFLKEQQMIEHKDD